VLYATACIVVLLDFNTIRCRRPAADRAGRLMKVLDFGVPLYAYTRARLVQGRCSARKCPTQREGRYPIRTSRPHRKNPMVWPIVRVIQTNSMFGKWL
jgi:hypothetical protein